MIRCMIKTKMARAMSLVTLYEKVNAKIVFQAMLFCNRVLRDVG